MSFVSPKRINLQIYQQLAKLISILKRWQWLWKLNKEKTLFGKRFTVVRKCEFIMRLIIWYYNCKTVFVYHKIINEFNSRTFIRWHFFWSHSLSLSKIYISWSKPIHILQEYSFGENIEINNWEKITCSLQTPRYSHYKIFLSNSIFYYFYI